MTDIRFDQFSEVTTVDLTAIEAHETSPSSTHYMKKITVLNKIKSYFKQNQYEKGASISNPDSGYISEYYDANGFKYTKDSSGNVRKVQRIVYVTIPVFAPTEICTTGDGKAYLPNIPADLNGMNLVSIHGRMITAGTTGTMDVQVRNVTDGTDMLSTKLTFDSTEVGTETAAAPAVIDGTKDDVATNDCLAIDVDAVHTTPGYGCYITLGFQYP